MATNFQEAFNPCFMRFEKQKNDKCLCFCDSHESLNVNSFIEYEATIN